MRTRYYAGTAGTVRETTEKECAMDTIKGWIARLTRQTRTTSAPNTPPLSTRDFDQERETGRTGQMSADDRAWEAGIPSRRQVRLAKRRH